MILLVCDFVSGGSWRDDRDAQRREREVILQCTLQRSKGDTVIGDSAH